MNERKSGYTLVLLPEEGGKSRSLYFSPRRIRIAVGLLAAVLVAFLLMASSWGYLAVQVSRGFALQSRVDSLESERSQIQSLVQQLERVEAEYDRLRVLFGPDSAPIAPDLWQPPSGLPGSRSVTTQRPERPDLPTSWPLTEAGFVTQALVETGRTDHPGVDIAIPTGSYVRAAARGRVLRLGEDPVYGHFLVLDHSDGYQTVYAHTSMILVDRGQLVRRNEVIALTGSTGRSTAPHLHFEILRDGVPVDPLSLVEPPG
jgi:murein DD-endopeptidase MepM/ murein hydrolase activator NlpD